MSALPFLPGAVLILNALPQALVEPLDHRVGLRTCADSVKREVLCGISPLCELLQTDMHRHVCHVKMQAYICHELTNWHVSYSAADKIRRHKPFAP